MSAVSEDSTLISRRADERSRSDRDRLLAIAESAAATAAELIGNADWSRAQARRKEDASLVTDLDLAAEACIRETILAIRPADEFLGEELSPTAGSSGVQWIVDPIDGTDNFVAGLPNWSISIAARVAGRIEVGVVRMPALKRTFTARAGGGAFCNGVPVSSRTKATGPFEDAIVATGFTADPDARARQLRQLQPVLGAVRDIRCHGAASVELCKLASGDLDAYYEADLRLWDVAAAALVAVEAGADVSGDPWSGPGTLVAARPHLASPLRRLVDTQLPR